MPANHILNPQRKAREDDITNPVIRANIGLLPLKTTVKSSRSSKSPKSTSSTKSSYFSPALQASQSVPKTTKEQSSTMNQKPLLLQLDPNLIQVIYKMSVFQNTYILRKWIDPTKLHLNELCKNPNSVSFFDKMFKLNPDANIHWNLLSSNPNAIELLKKRIEYEKTIDITNLEVYKQINWKKLSKNPNAIELLEQKIKEEKTLDPYILENLKYYQKIDWDILCKNPNAIELLKANIPEIKRSIFYNKNIDEAIITILLSINKQFGNNIIWSIPKATRLLTKIFPDKDTYAWHQISLNTSYKAITLLETKALEEKQLILEDPLVYKLLSRYNRKIINWDNVSSNPKAIELLKRKILEEKQLKDFNFNGFGLIHWNNLSSNPKAITLLEEKAIEEKHLRYTNFKEYQSLADNLKINWNIVTAISLLETKAIEEKHLRYTNFKAYEALHHIERINWYILSSNPKAITLLESKIIEEHEMREVEPEKYKALNYASKINSEKLSANPKAIKLLEKYPEYIDFKGLCANPNAVKLIRKNIDDFKTADWEILSVNPCIFYETRN
jgi:hypothetical protein